MDGFRFETVQLPPEAEALREEVRTFLAAERQAGSFVPLSSSWTSFDPDFSRKCAERGYIGMTWPKAYGGHERSEFERYVVVEEMLAGGAPVGAHWIADRQSGPQILAHGTEEMRRKILPQIAAGRCYFGIGMSEPDSGSDLASVRTRARRGTQGWVINGTKIWTSNAHRAHYLIALVRTDAPGEDRHAGLTQFVIEMARSGISVRPIYNLYGGRDFNEVVFNDYVASDDEIVGEVGQGWRMVTSELALERSGADRYLSDYQMLLQLIREVARRPDTRGEVAVGRLVSHLATIRHMSLAISAMLQRRESPELEAAVVKDIGTNFEQEIPEIARQIVYAEPEIGAGDPYQDVLARTILAAPSFTLRGGTREILRGIIARGLSLR